MKNTGNNFENHEKKNAAQKSFQMICFISKHAHSFIFVLHLQKKTRETIFFYVKKVKTKFISDKVLCVDSK